MSALIVIGIIGLIGAGLYYMDQQNANSNDTGAGSYPPSGGDSGATVGQSVTPSPSGLSLDDKIQNMAHAIGRAEGADRPGTVPNRYGNPGDLSVGDDYFGTSTGHTTLPDGENLLIFRPGATWDTGDGWDALVEKVKRMLTGESTAYGLDNTFTDVAKRYAGNWQPWVANVTQTLGVTPDNTLRDYVNM